MFSLRDSSQSPDPTTDDLFNFGIRLEKDLTKLETKVSEQVTVCETAHSQKSFLSIYTEFVGKILSGLQLVITKPHEPAQFDFEFVRKFYQTKDRILAVEETHGIPCDNRLSTVIKSRWGEYCASVISSLESKVDFVSIFTNMPDKFRTKESLRVGSKDPRQGNAPNAKVNSQLVTALQFLQGVQNDLDTCYQSLSKLRFKTEEKEQVQTDGEYFQEEATRRFSDLVEQKIGLLISKLDNLDGNSNRKNTFKALLLIHTILTSDTVNKTLKAERQQDLKCAWNLQAEKLITNLETEDLYSELESLFSDLKVCWVDQTPCSFLTAVSSVVLKHHPEDAVGLVLSTLTPEGASNHTLASQVASLYPSIVPFTVAPSDNRPLLQRMGQPLVTTFDGFTHEELLSQLLP